MTRFRAKLRFIFLGLVLFTLILSCVLLRHHKLWRQKLARIQAARAQAFLLDVTTLQLETDVTFPSFTNTKYHVTGNTEQRHLVYVRIPKTGSSTITYLIWRFGLSRKLKFLLPRQGGEGNQQTLTESTFYLPAENDTFDIMANHVRFNYSNYKPYFPRDTVYISLIREPLNHLASTLEALNDQIKIPKLPKVSIVSSFLKNPQLYEPKKMDHSFTKNPVTYYFGLPRDYFDITHRVLDLIEEIEQRFKLVMILERFDESLILLRRLMGWTIKDVLYIKSYAKRKRNRNLTFSQIDKDRLCDWSFADCIFYTFFLEKLNKSIKKQNNSFLKEVAVFKTHILRTEAFCAKVNNSDDAMKFEATMFHQEFKLTSIDCKFMTMTGLTFLDNIRQLQINY